MFEPTPLSPSRHIRRNWHGAITQIDNWGTIVQMWVRTDEGRMVPVNFEHRPFWHMAHARRVDRVVGYAVTYDERGPTPYLRFDDDEQLVTRPDPRGEDASP